LSIFYYILPALTNSTPPIMVSFANESVTIHNAAINGVINLKVTLDGNDPAAQSRKPDIQIPAVIMPEGYNGKILLVSVSGGGIKKTVLLRSGDLWHREILRNTATEIKSLGFESALVDELGGALVRFEPDGAITIYGASQEFGACDKELAAEMIKKEFRERTVQVRE